DREIHDFFFNLSFKGADIEKAQLSRLVDKTEFKLAANVQPPLREVFNSTEEGTFIFYISFSNRLLSEVEELVAHHLPQDKLEKIEEITWVFKESRNVEDFWYNMDLRGILKENELSADQ